MVHIGPSDPDASAKLAPPREYVPPIPPPDELPAAFLHLWHTAARLQDDFNRAEYYRQRYLKLMDGLEQQIHALRATNWRHEMELMHLHLGNDWTAAAEFIRDRVHTLVADPKLSRRQLLAGINQAVEEVRAKGIGSKSGTTAS